MNNKHCQVRGLHQLTHHIMLQSVKIKSWSSSTVPNTNSSYCTSLGSLNPLRVPTLNHCRCCYSSPGLLCLTNKGQKGCSVEHEAIIGHHNWIDSYFRRYPCSLIVKNLWRTCNLGRKKKTKQTNIDLIIGELTATILVTMKPGDSWEARGQCAHNCLDNLIEVSYYCSLLLCPGSS